MFKFDQSRPGIISLTEAIQLPDGRWAQGIWYDNWRILTDDVIRESIPGFRSSEHWQAVALDRDTGDLIAIIPGCKVRSFVVVRECPANCDHL